MAAARRIIPRRASPRHATRLAVDGCAHAFFGAEVLHGIDLELRRGTVHGIVGPNGSGKTTLLEILGGSLRPDAGRVLLDGRAVRFRHPRNALAAGIVLVHQRPEVFPDVTVEEYLGFVAGSRHRAAPAAAVSALDSVGARIAPRATLDSLTAAERQLLELARALLLEPCFLLLDEPTAFLERQTARRVLALVERLRDRGVGIVLVSQRLEEVATHADRTTVLRDGRVCARLERHETDAETLFGLIAGSQVPEGSGAEMVRMRERQRLAMDLHDSVAQVLFAIGAEARTALDAGSRPVLERSLRSIGQIANRARSELRDTLTRLNRVPTSLSLQALLDSELRSFGETAGIEATLVRSGDSQPLGDLKEALLIDTLVEALQNVRKHAAGHDERPRHVVASLGYRNGTVHLSVQNDGPRRTLPPAVEGTDMRGGLRLLAERAEQLRGELHVKFPDEGGAVVRLRLPATEAGAR